MHPCLWNSPDSQQELAHIQLWCKAHIFRPAIHFQAREKLPVWNKIPRKIQLNLISFFL